jgi:hypothetical protein
VLCVRATSTPPIIISSRMHGACDVIECPVHSRTPNRLSGRSIARRKMHAVSVRGFVPMGQIVIHTVAALIRSRVNAKYAPALWRDCTRIKRVPGPFGHGHPPQDSPACSGGLVTEQIFDFRFRFSGRTNWPTLRLGQFCQSHKPWERGRCVNGKPRRLSGRRSHLTS